MNGILPASLLSSILKLWKQDQNQSLTCVVIKEMLIQAIQLNLKSTTKVCFVTYFDMISFAAQRAKRVPHCTLASNFHKVMSMNLCLQVKNWMNYSFWIEKVLSDDICRPFVSGFLWLLTNRIIYSLLFYIWFGFWNVIDHQTSNSCQLDSFEV